MICEKCKCNQNWNANFKQRQNEYKMSKPIFKATFSTTLSITKVPWLNWEGVRMLNDTLSKMAKNHSIKIKLTLAD